MKTRLLGAVSALAFVDSGGVHERPGVEDEGGWALGRLHLSEGPHVYLRLGRIQPPCVHAL